MKTILTVLKLKVHRTVPVQATRLFCLFAEVQLQQSELLLTLLLIFQLELQLSGLAALLQVNSVLTLLTLSSKVTTVLTGVRLVAAVPQSLMVAILTLLALLLAHLHKPLTEENLPNGRS